MDKQKKNTPQKKISYDDMMRYLTRFKVKKQRRILPRTFANSQGLSISRLQPTTPAETKKPIINKNVKARLESNLDFLLQNQSKVIKRFRQPESYISLKVNKAKEAANKNQIQRRNAKDKEKNGRSESNHFGSKIDLPQKSIENKVVEIQSSESAQKSRHDSRKKANSFHFDENSSFAFDTFENDIRAGDRSTAPTLSGVSSSFFKDSLNKNHGDKQMNWSFDEPKFTEPPSVATSHRHSRNVNKRHRDSSFNSIGFDECSSIDFGLDRNRIRTKREEKRRNNYETDWSHLDFEPNRSPTGSFGYFDQNSFDDQRINQSTIRKTRIIKSSVSRVGESPFMEQIVIQKVKRQF